MASFGDNPIVTGRERLASQWGTWCLPATAVLYPFAETRKLLYEGAKQAGAAIPKCKPYKTTLPIKGKLQSLTFGEPDSKPKLVTKEREMPSALDILNF
jgi:hypothetical protein